MATLLLVIAVVALIIWWDKPVVPIRPSIKCRKRNALEARYDQWAADKQRRGSEVDANKDLT